MNLEPLDIRNLSLRIDGEGHITLDIQVGEQWRRVIKTFHGGYTHYCCGRAALEVRDETMDVTAEYRELEELEGEEMSRPKRTMTATIEGQVKRARDLLQGFGPAFDRPREISTGILVLGNICAVLIRTIENQQFQIEQLQRQIEDLESGPELRGRR